MGAIYCIFCLAGRFGGVSSLSACLECAAGYYSNKSGAKICATCVSGQFRLASKSCIECAPGTYADAGASACTTCSLGLFASIGSSSCRASCAPGHFITSGSNLCTECPAGRFQPASPAAVCLACAPGQYAASFGSASCKLCQVGAYSAVSGSSVCQSCSRGQYAADYSAVCRSDQTGVGVKSQAELIAAVKITGNIIKFLADIRLTATIVVSTPVALFGNGHKLDGQNKVQCLYITGGGNIDITGLTITGGSTSADCSDREGLCGGPGYNAGGIFANGANLRLTSCSIVSNTGIGRRMAGGGIFLQNGVFTLTGCYIGNNAITGSAYEDDGSYYYSGSSGDGKSNGGGGIYLVAGSLLMTSCNVVSNTANHGGGLFVFDSSPVTIIGCSFSLNSAT